MKKNVLDGLRWIVFIPGGIIAGAIAHAVVLLFFGAGSWLSGMRFDAPINQFFAAGLSGYAGTMAAAFIAPSLNKKIPAVIVTTIIVLISIYGIIFSLNSGEWMRSVLSAITLGGAVMAAVHSENLLA